MAMMPNVMHGCAPHYYACGPLIWLCLKAAVFRPRTGSFYKLHLSRRIPTFETHYEKTSAASMAWGVPPRSSRSHHVFANRTNKFTISWTKVQNELTRNRGLLIVTLWVPLQFHDDTLCSRDDRCATSRMQRSKSFGI